MYLKSKKLLKKMNIFAINVLNFYKMLKMKLALKYTLFGMKMHKSSLFIRRSLADYIFRKENVSDKNCNIPKEALSIYLNSSIQDIKESLWVALHLRCPFKSLYVELCNSACLVVML